MFMGCLTTKIQVDIIACKIYNIRKPMVSRSY
jgi:hypothetical protein